MNDYRSRYERHDTHDLFIWRAQIFMGETVTFIRNCSGHVYSGRTSIISSGKALYLALRPMILELVMVFVASNGDCFCSVRYLGCHSLCRLGDLAGAPPSALGALPGWPLVE